MSDICQFLLSLGITPNYLGFHYAAYALSLCLNEPQRLTYITKELYPDVAERFHTSSDSVERNIRTIIAVAWVKNSSILIQLSKGVLAGRPSVSEFLSILVIHFLYGGGE